MVGYGSCEEKERKLYFGAMFGVILGLQDLCLFKPKCIYIVLFMCNCYLLLFLLFMFVLDYSIHKYTLQRWSLSDSKWKTIRSNVVNFGIHGYFMYASVLVEDSATIVSRLHMVIY